MNLTDTAIRRIKGAESARKLADGKGLYLLVTTKGRRYWRWKYRHLGKERVMALGVYPEVSLALARERHREARLLLSTGVDPVSARRQQEEGVTAFVTFKQAAQKWFDHWSTQQKRDGAKAVWGRLNHDVFPILGKKPVADISASDFRDMAMRVEVRAPTVARRMLMHCSQIMRYAVAHDLAERNPVTDLKAGDVLRSHKSQNHVRVDAKDLPALLYAIKNYSGGEPARLALQLLALTFVRTRELIEATWEELDLDNARWDIPAERMKMKLPHIVPLSKQAVDAFKRLKVISNGGDFVFPGRDTHTKPMSRGTMLMALGSMGYKGVMTGHGFRGVASTILHEQDYPHDHIELQLAHQSKSAVSAAYNHAQYIKPRTKMMQEWADYLIRQQDGFVPPT
ncbi:MAG: tyrosine-type recombinase/integrase [Pseudomonas sp.]|nr:tyrosine-type recombinase/integrase [Pseudomonas sp.]